MKYKFGDSNIITCYIKELLHSFNLPRVAVYTKDLEEVTESKDAFGNIVQSNNALYDGRVYIKDKLIMQYKDGKFTKLANYLYNYPVVNFTKNFIIKSSIYDDYTHSYLGDFLRFIRDYNGVDLMSMYNCFSGKEPGRIKLVDENNKDGVDIKGYRFKIDTDKNDFEYYIVPVKFDKTYTMAMNINSGYEMACILYGDIFVSNTPDELIKQSYTHINGSTFSNPYTYSTKFNCTKDLELWKREKDLKLILKLPKNINTSIVILEGDYAQSGNVLDGCLFTKTIGNMQKTTIEDNSLSKWKNIPKYYPSKLSLLDIDDKVSHPFADKLIEYLLRNAITSDEFISQNIEYVQEMVYPKGIQGFYGLWDELLRYNIYQRTLKQDLTKNSVKKYTNDIIEYDSSNSLTISDENTIDNKLYYILDAENLFTYKENTEGELVKERLNISPKSLYELVGNDSLIIYYIDKNNNIINLGEMGEGYIINNSTNSVLINKEVWGRMNIDDYIITYNELEFGSEDSIQLGSISSSKREIRFLDTHTEVNGYVDKDVESLLKLQLAEGVE